MSMESFTARRHNEENIKMTEVVFEGGRNERDQGMTTYR